MITPVVFYGINLIYSPWYYSRKIGMLIEYRFVLAYICWLNQNIDYENNS